MRCDVPERFDEIIRVPSANLRSMHRNARIRITRMPVTGGLGWANAFLKQIIQFVWELELPVSPPPTRTRQRKLAAEKAPTPQPEIIAVIDSANMTATQ